MKLNLENRRERLALTLAMVETVKEVGVVGAPAGPLYAALMTAGVTLEQFESIMRAAVAAKMLRKSGHVYYYVGGAK